MLPLAPAVEKKIARRDSLSSLRFHSELFEVFHENTKLGRLSGRAYGAHVSRFLASKALCRLTEQPYKVYSLGDRVELDPVPAASDLERTIAARRSQRRFSGEPIGREELSRLLFYSYGRTDAGGRFRAVASGGGLYPLEIYVVPHRVEGLEPWLYHYDVEHHRLDVVAREDRWPAARECVWMQDMKDPDQAAALILVTAVFERSTLKYLDRGYRLVLMEAGEVGHAMLLMATSLGLGAYALGGFLDDELSALLDVDGIDEAPLLPIVVGRPGAGGAGGGG